MSDRRPQAPRRGYREIPGASVRVRGQNDRPYNPGRPLRLPRDRRPWRRPQFNLGALARLLFPVALLAGLGVGVFFGVDALLDDGDGEAAPSVTEPGGGAAAESPETTSDAAAIEGGAGDATEGDSAQSAEATTGAATGSPVASTDGAGTTEDAVSAVPTTPRILTPADLGGAEVVLERGAARPVPAGIPERTWANGDPYDPTDAEAAYSSVWAAGTVIEVTRLPGAPLLSEEDAADLIGKTIRIVVRGEGSFPEELQLTPAAYALVAEEIEPIIAVRIEVVEPPPEA